MAFICNEEGYLLDPATWTSDFAVRVMASDLGRVPTQFDWIIIAFVREFYEMHHMMPLTRRIVSHACTQVVGFDSVQLQQHYTNKPLWVIAKISGLPKPVQCI